MPPDCNSPDSSDIRQVSWTDPERREFLSMLKARPVYQRLGVLQRSVVEGNLDKAIIPEAARVVIDRIIAEHIQDVF